MKKPLYFGEREVAEMAMAITIPFDQEGDDLTTELSGTFKNEQYGDVSFSMLIEKTVGFYARAQAYNVWLNVKLPGASVKELLGRGSLEETNSLLLQLSNIDEARGRLYKIYEDLDRMGKV
jgi:endonuclease V-like protein UPF0215 family